jgi:hypothetical protein
MAVTAAVMMTKANIPYPIRRRGFSGHFDKFVIAVIGGMEHLSPCPVPCCQNDIYPVKIVTG